LSRRYKIDLERPELSLGKREEVAVLLKPLAPDLVPEVNHFISIYPNGLKERV
jgi:hypothetical protein